MSAVDNWNEFVSGTDVNDELDQDTVCETIELAVDALAELEVERDKWEWVARDACRELAYETHVNPQSPLDYRLANWRPRED